MSQTYIFLHLKIINGEYEYSSKTVHELQDEKTDPVDFAESYASTFYDKAEDQDDDDTDGDWYYFHGGAVAVKVGHVRLITKEQYDTLKDIIIL